MQILPLLLPASFFEVCDGESQITNDDVPKSLFASRV